MNNEQYIAALKRALSALDRAQREEILREIRSHLADAPEVDSLQSRFGPVEDLARQYLDGQPLPPSLSGRLGRAGKMTLLGIGAFVVVAVLSVTLMFWVLGGDKFDYADESAPAREIDAAEWSVIDWQGPINLRVEQAQAVVYWHDAAQIRWHCRGRMDLDPVAGRELKVRHGFCLLYLPLQAATAEVLQADLVLVRPRASMTLEIEQAELRIAENGERYRYEFELANSETAEFRSDSGAATVITVSANESSLQAYAYR